MICCPYLLHFQGKSTFMVERQREKEIKLSQKFPFPPELLDFYKKERERNQKRKKERKEKKNPPSSSFMCSESILFRQKKFEGGKKTKTKKKTPKTKISEVKMIKNFPGGSISIWKIIELKLRNFPHNKGQTQPSENSSTKRNIKPILLHNKQHLPASLFMDVSLTFFKIWF